MSGAAGQEGGVGQQPGDGNVGDSIDASGASSRMRRMLPRTVPDGCLNFTMRHYVGADTSDRYPNVHGVHPAEFKVELMVG